MLCHFIYFIVNKNSWSSFVKQTIEIYKFVYETVEVIKTNWNMLGREVISLPFIQNKWGGERKEEEKRREEMGTVVGYFTCILPSTRKRESNLFLKIY